MQKTKKSILASIAIFAMVAMSIPVFAASGDRALPAEDDMFWYIFADMTTPDDYGGCVAALDNYIAQYPDIFNTDEIRDGVRSEMTGMCTGVGQMRAEMQTDMMAEGVTSNLFADTTTDWHNVSGLYFEKSGTGKIEFANTIDFMSYRFMSFMSDFRSMVKFDDGYISLNASMVPQMANFGATLTMYGLDQFSEQPDIQVGTGASMKKAVVGQDFSGIVWDATTKTLSFTPSHFSSFKAVAKGSKLKAMKISSVQKKTIKYKAGKTFKLTVKGRNLYKKRSDVTCTMGFQQAEEIHAGRAGNRVKCTFGMDSFSSLGTFPLTITVSGRGEVTKTNAVRIK